MQSNKEAFAELVGKLRDALAAGDWEAISVLDEKCSALVANLRDEDAFDTDLRRQIEELSRLYEELQRTGRAERERIAAELTRLSQSKQVTNAYKPLR
ncbi:flagellar protein FliT [Stutzerimonas xanthomarina]|uniref:Flagellar protein FliT n=1 Tax=Stutzerimonas xanthomarina TaxID=271420 RepID=A0A3R8U4V5_9GAMM|nr:flagellar protein FliT [Stutzerimonas xanthomarina]RRV11406.1 flagellar protein FliT [Stutzerimonas xanthomarina]